MNMEPDLASPAKVSQILGIPETTLAQWRWLGKGPEYRKIGRHVRYEMRHVSAWLNAQESGGSRIVQPPTGAVA